MARIRRSAEQITSNLRVAEVLIGKGIGTGSYEAAWCHRADVLPIAQEVRRLKTDLAKKLKRLERENTRLA